MAMVMTNVAVLAFVSAMLWVTKWACVPSLMSATVMTVAIMAVALMSAKFIIATLAAYTSFGGAMELPAQLVAKVISCAGVGCTAWWCYNAVWFTMLINFSNCGAIRNYSPPLDQVPLMMIFATLQVIVAVVVPTMIVKIWENIWEDILVIVAIVMMVVAAPVETSIIVMETVATTLLTRVSEKLQKIWY